METIEGNKLIAEFMGGKLDHPNSPYYYFLEKGRYETELKYHLSWDWLMPVVKKCLIREAENSNQLFFENIYDALISINITDTFDLVVKFIKLKQ